MENTKFNNNLFVYMSVYQHYFSQLRPFWFTLFDVYGKVNSVVLKFCAHRADKWLYHDQSTSVQFFADSSYLKSFQRKALVSKELTHVEAFPPCMREGRVPGSYLGGHTTVVTDKYCL